MYAPMVQVFRVVAQCDSGFAHPKTETGPSARSPVIARTVPGFGWAIRDPVQALKFASMKKGAYAPFFASSSQLKVLRHHSLATPSA
jgi:hypothetical protein